MMLLSGIFSLTNTQQHVLLRASTEASMKLMPGHLGQLHAMMCNCVTNCQHTDPAHLLQLLQIQEPQPSWPQPPHLQMPASRQLNCQHTGPPHLLQ